MMDSAQPDAAPWQPEDGETVLREVKGNPAGDLQSLGRARILVSLQILLVSGIGVWGFYMLWTFMLRAGWQILSDLDSYPVILLGEGFKALLLGLFGLGYAAYLAWNLREILKMDTLDRYVFTDRRVLTVGLAGSVSEETQVSEIRVLIDDQPARRNRFRLERREGAADMHPLWIDPVEEIGGVIDFVRRRYRVPVERPGRSQKRGR